MVRRSRLVIILIIALLTLAICALIYPIAGRMGMRLGLDLVGGVHLVYQVDFPEGATAEDKARSMDRTIETIRTRIDKYGVVEPVIQQEGENRILVELPGFTDIEAAKELVEQTGFLEFREIELNEEGSPVYLGDYLEGTSTDFFDSSVEGSRIFVDGEAEGKFNPIAFLNKDEEGNLIFTDESGNPIDIEELKQLVEQIGEQGPSLVSWMPARGDDGTELTGSLLARATPTLATTATGPEAQVDIEWNSEGAVIFDQIASRLYERPSGSIQRALGIFLDGVLISYPQILEPAYEGRGVITGNFTIEEVERLANLMESGALPMPLQKPPLFEEKVSATLGADFIDMSIKAGIIGIILVMVFMAIYYRLPGVMASIALVFYAAVVLAIFKLIPVTLTLAGIGGFVLSIGMAVDANVLIFERMKEELKMGRTLGAAIEVGFNRAWTGIRDSNITTFIVCLVLYVVGSNVVAGAPVMGFATTLFFGVAISMFTAIVVTRTLLRLLVGTRLAQKMSLFKISAGGENV